MELTDAEEKAATVIGVAVASYYFVFGGLWFLFHYLWTWRASNNLSRLGSHGRTYHPALLIVVAIVGLFSLGIAFPFVTILVIPISAFIPLLITQEIWRGSNPAYLIEGTNWKTGKGSFLVTTWWLLSMVFPILILLPLVPTKLDLVIQIEWFYLTIGILIAYCVIYVLVIMRVNYRQYAKYMAWASQGGVVSRKPGRR